MLTSADASGRLVSVLGSLVDFFGFPNGLSLWKSLPPLEGGGSLASRSVQLSGCESESPRPFELSSLNRSMPRSETRIQFRIN